MIDFDKMTPHELACFLIGEALIKGESEAYYKGEFWRVFYRETYFAIDRLYVDERVEEHFDSHYVGSCKEVYEYFDEILNY